MSEARSVFFISDRTGITAETLGHSLLTQFSLEAAPVSMPFTDSPDAVDAAIDRIEASGQADGPARSFSAPSSTPGSAIGCAG